MFFSCWCKFEEFFICAVPIRNVNMLAIITETFKQRLTIKKLMCGLLNVMIIVGDDCNILVGDDCNSDYNTLLQLYCNELK